ncbi:ABC transporter permease [Marivirga atlantica]|uniref:ABC transporter permease n=1 Tax=Marivirga atlantica TaxID=1548457 RepID=A0A937DK29_9BACT|nr:ABC transporter permease [Marivirga atlantica]MBL0766550.1 ABC transporter permease [Marivirga atlantica]
MNLPDFIAKRTINAKGGAFSGSIYRIAISSVAIGLAIMLMSILILGGFKQQIADKIYSFTGHLQVSKYTLSNSLESSPTTTNTDFYHNWQDLDYIKSVQAFAYKAGLLKANDAVEGVIIKGVGVDFDTASFSKNMVEGTFPNFTEDEYTTDVVISEKLAKLLQIKVKDKLLMYFVQNPPRYRQLTITGIFQTGLEEFDERIIIGDMGMIQRLNDWETDQVGGYEIFLKQGTDIDEAETEIFDKVNSDQFVNNSKQKYNQYFEWLDLLNQNVRVFLGLILFVACFNMAAVLFILIMERTNMIGLLKAVGADNGLIRRIFYFSGIRLTLKGLLYGNVLALGLAALQYHFQIIPLDAENYYMSYVPILWDVKSILLINLAVLLLVGVALTLPTFLVTRLKPIKAIRFD